MKVTYSEDLFWILFQPFHCFDSFLVAVRAVTAPLTQWQGCHHLSADVY